MITPMNFMIDGRLLHQPTSLPWNLILSVHKEVHYAEQTFSCVNHTCHEKSPGL